jgi:nucleoside-diphosphate-sugar epimerase
MDSARRLLVTGGSGFIGTAVVDRFTKAGWTVFNLDKAAPKLSEHSAYWQNLDLLDGAAVTAAVKTAAPTHVIHLAARTDTDSDVLDDYRENTEGTRNLLDALAGQPDLRVTVLTSSQYVLRPGLQPRDDEHFDPHTVYGQSKVLTEQSLRSAKLAGDWVIVRPTNIWGPWHPRYPREFWRTLSRGLYLHPSGGPIPRSYGYVGTVAAQFESILTAPAGALAGRVFYLGDPAVMLEDWVNGFSVALKGRPVRVVPRGVLKVLARAGDVVQRLGGKAPLTSSRLTNMIEPHIAPMDATFEALGPPAYTLQEGIDETVDWLVHNGFRAAGQPAAEAKTSSIAR